jgi:hypothetical protein
MAQRCECADGGCPCCHGNCEREATVVLYRADMEDATGTPLCEGCADDAMDSGLFTADAEPVDDGEDDTAAGQVARRAVALLGADIGVTYRYAMAAVDAGLVDEEDLRGWGRGSSKRWHLA